MKRIRLLSCILAALMLVSAVPMTGAAQNDDTAAAAVDTLAVEETTGETETTKEKLVSYMSYLGKKQNKENANIDKIELVNSKTATDSVVVPFSVKEEGLYTLSFVYWYNQAGNKNTTYDILIDGKIPYSEVSSRTLSRIWKNETEIKADEVTGDDISPKQVEVRDYKRLYTVYDREGYYADPLQFWLEKGDHTVTFAMSNDQVDISNVIFTYAQALPTYEEYKADKGSAPVYSGDVNLAVQGENATNKSEMFLIAQNDITDPLTQPSKEGDTFKADRIQLNTFGGANWKLTGETAEWKVEVPETGYYKMSIRYRQNFYDGVSAHRRLYVNGEVPFAEANALEFPYKTTWQTFTLRNENKEDLYVYLEAGQVNTISLEVMLGSSAKIAEEMQACVLDMNTIYRQIIMITGSSPDDYRDYQIDEQIPTILQDLTNARDRLQAISDEIAAQYGAKSSLIAKIDNIIRQLNIMIEKPAQISKSDRLGSFKGNISTIGSWISMFCEQPLEIDRIEFYGDNGKAPRAGCNFFESIGHSVNRFIASFTKDYSSMGISTEGASTSIKVWIQSGRDQANILKQLITSDFTPTYNAAHPDAPAAVEMELVTGAIIEATLAGKGPDIAISRAVTDPVNFAMRNALVDLKQFDDYDEVVSKYFVPDADKPFLYNGGSYALPETMTYQMMFVRTDIMEDLDLALPETWDELLTEVYPIVSRNNMEIGIGNMNQISAMNASNIFTNLLYQMGGQIYSDDLRSTALDTQVAYQAFDMSVELYADYLFPQEYDAMSRFRTGEMPILLADYTMYNVFAISIPELDGLWEMYPIPGVRKDDGSVDNSQAATEVATVMFKGIEDEKAGWEFLKWWVSTDVQAEFGTRVEAVLGPGGRYATANKEALKMLPWNDEQLGALESQMEKLVFVEQLPGSYFTSRAINSAFMTSVLSSKNPTEQLLYWSEQINLELDRKYEEFAD